MINDHIADMLTRIRNALMATHDDVSMPLSKMKLSITKKLKQEGLINDYEVLKGEPQSMLGIHLKYIEGQSAILGLERVSKLGLRVYVGRREIPRVYGGLGIAILSTPKGVMTGQQAWRNHVGGEFLCRIW